MGTQQQQHGHTVGGTQQHVWMQDHAAAVCAPCAQPFEAPAKPKFEFNQFRQNLGAPVQGITDQELDWQEQAYPPVNSPNFSKWAVLGVCQQQSGERFLELARLGKHEHMRYALSPKPPESFRR